MSKQKTSFTLSEDALKLLKSLADKLGRSQANTIEYLIKEAAIKEKIPKS
jgi:predicted DNA-binding protein